MLREKLRIRIDPPNRTSGKPPLVLRPINSFHFIESQMNNVRRIAKVKVKDISNVNEVGNK